MSTLELPLDPLVVSIGFRKEKGPGTGNNETPLHLDYNDLNPDDLRRIAPDRVLSWLFCPTYDAYDVARFLVQVGFLGTYCAVVQDLPNPEGVTREIRRCFPGLDFCLRSPCEVSAPVKGYHDYVADQSAALQLAPV